MGSEEILVLYGSQTGNSEGAAQEIASLVPSRLKSPPADADGASGDGTPCSARCLQLDDFLEAERASWPRLVVIVCSSYGVGHAPLGAQKFREACDAILERGGGDRFLEGVKFALLGLGDSHYTTFFQNPTTINDALTAAGATRVGELGKADASGRGEDEQAKVVERWMDGIWKDLADVVASPHPGGEALARAREGTWGVCLEIFPEWKAKGSAGLVAPLPLMAVLALVLGGLLYPVLARRFLGRGGDLDEL